MLARLALLLLLAAAATGCARGGGEEAHVLVIDDATLEDMEAAALAQGLVAFDESGGIVPALAESWHVSDDGTSYIFRLATGRWSDGEPIEAEEVARLLQRRFVAADRAIGDRLGKVAEVEAMTERVIEIRLSVPRPYLLQLLAQPLFAVRDEDVATGPFTRLPGETDEGALILGRLPDDPDADVVTEQRVRIERLSVEQALDRFAEGKADLVTGGRFDTLGLAQAASGLFGAPRLDPVGGLFGLQPVSDHPLLAKPDTRSALSSAIDRDALVQAMNVPDLLPRATILQSGLDVSAAPTVPAFVAIPVDERREAARRVIAEAQVQTPILRVLLPDGPGSDPLLARLVADWGTLGIAVERAPDESAADLVLIDKVAPVVSAAWYLREFRCAAARWCSAAADEALVAAADATTADERALALGAAARLLQQDAVFIPLAAPVRWSLLGNGVEGFVPNRFARHGVEWLRAKGAR